jgi:hypothetical protein
MADAGIYRKTEKGRNEIATRANKLGLRERTMLIMVDDKTTRAGLVAKNTHPTSDGIINDLLARGYIEVVRDTAAADAAPAPATAEPAAAAPPRRRPTPPLPAPRRSKCRCNPLRAMPAAPWLPFSVPGQTT